MIGQRIRVRGTVQGVGFRPTVWKLANALNLLGAVWNDPTGVVIEVWGTAANLEAFVSGLSRECPPLATIDGIDREPLTGCGPGRGFVIRTSTAGEARTDVTPDAATCDTCLSEVGDPADRRYRYPFTNCTHCGPRLSIVQAIPYDRGNTSMSSFTMCSACLAEYNEPSDRRFHAQPNACPVCGPQIWLEAAGSPVSPPDSDEDPLREAARLIACGEILAIKGIGGIHLACDACNGEAVNRLRRRKHRYHKAFALMARDLTMVRRYARIGIQEEQLLRAIPAPIVIVDAEGEPVAEGVAPGQQTLGFMLPYTPLHHLLMAALEGPIVLTSGNRSDEPQCTKNRDARNRLEKIADYLLLHDREIVNRLDDSVTRVMAGSPRILRRARGYAPAPVALPPGFDGDRQLLAMGGELKSTFCMLQQRRAILSQHMGDLENAATYQDYRRNLALYLDLFQHRPQAIAVDLHPEYLASKLGGTLAAERELSLIGVQHHHAHIAACMAEHGLPLATPPVVGVALDGLGQGDDGTFWGGEFLLADYRGFRRLGHLQPMPLLGGAQAMREPWRNCYAHLSQLLGWEWVTRHYAGLEIVRYLRSQPLGTLDTMMERGINCPPASSCGRLFDAVAAALGICRDRQDFEGQAAMELESLATPFFLGQRDGAYPFDVQRPRQGLRVIGFESLWRTLLEDLRRGMHLGLIAARFHQGICALVESVVAEICDEQRVSSVVLGGGVFQNRLLLEGLIKRLAERGLTVLSPARVPANDGGLSLGQAVVAAAQLSSTSEEMA
ncbi:MAG: carbamoyltransferase HypF [Gammaproteobacteria bacterium]|nr:carbamoyltransferase HypF [Gammaproteobacteria bacterium]